MDVQPFNVLVLGAGPQPAKSWVQSWLVKHEVKIANKQDDESQSLYQITYAVNGQPRDVFLLIPCGDGEPDAGVISWAHGFLLVVDLSLDATVLERAWHTQVVRAKSNTSTVSKMLFLSPDELKLPMVAVAYTSSMEALASRAALTRLCAEEQALMVNSDNAKHLPLVLTLCVGTIVAQRPDENDTFWVHRDAIRTQMRAVIADQQLLADVTSHMKALHLQSVLLMWIQLDAMLRADAGGGGGDGDGAAADDSLRSILDRFLSDYLGDYCGCPSMYPALRKLFSRLIDEAEEDVSVPISDQVVLSCIESAELEVLKVMYACKAHQVVPSETSAKLMSPGRGSGKLRKKRSVTMPKVNLKQRGSRSSSSLVTFEKCLLERSQQFYPVMRTAMGILYQSENLDVPASAVSPRRRRGNSMKSPRALIRRQSAEKMKRISVSKNAGSQMKKPTRKSIRETFFTPLQVVLDSHFKAAEFAAWIVEYDIVKCNPFHPNSVHTFYLKWLFDYRMRMPAHSYVKKTFEKPLMHLNLSFSVNNETVSQENVAEFMSVFHGIFEVMLNSADEMPKTLRAAVAQSLSTCRQRGMLEYKITNRLLVATWIVPMIKSPQNYGLLTKANRDVLEAVGDTLLGISRGARVGDSALAQELDSYITANETMLEQFLDDIASVGCIPPGPSKKAATEAAKFRKNERTFGLYINAVQNVLAEHHEALVGAHPDVDLEFLKLSS